MLPHTLARHSLAIVLGATLASASHASDTTADVVIDFEGLPGTPVGTGDLVPVPGSVVTDQYQGDGVLFGQAGVSAGVAVVLDTLAPSSGINTVGGLDADGILPSVPGAGSIVGDIYFRFVVPGSEVAAATDFVAFTIGDGGGDLDLFTITTYDLDGAVVSSGDFSGTTRFEVTLASAGIHRVEIDFLGDFGYSLDDLCFDDPSAPECFLLLGASSTYWALPVSPEDTLLVIPAVSYEVLLTDIPTFDIPASPVFHGLQLFGQVYMDNPIEFPGDPYKMSNGLRVTLGVGAQSYGPSTGMQLWLEQEPQLGGTLQFQFSIDGF